MNRANRQSNRRADSRASPVLPAIFLMTRDDAPLYSEGSLFLAKAKAQYAFVGDLLTGASPKEANLHHARVLMSKHIG